MLSTALQFIKTIPALILAITKLVELLEQAMPESGQGLTKKEYILAAIKQLFSIGEDIWSSVEGIISAFITITAMLKFGSKSDI